MREYLFNMIGQSTVLSFEEVLFNILMAAVIGIVIYLSYLYTHASTVYSKKFNVSLMMLTILTATVMTVIGSNLVLSLGMVGALSIVRYRTAIKDSRDTAYIFWAIIVGICCGAGSYLIGAVGTAVVFVLLLLFGRVRNDNRMLLIIRASRGVENQIESTVYQYFSTKVNLKVKNTTGDTVELIYEVAKKNVWQANNQEESITDALYKIGKLDYVNLVSQTDEVNG